MEIMLRRILLTGFISAAIGLAQTPQPVPKSAIGGAVVGTQSFLGVGIQEIGSDRAKALKLPEEAGVEITHVAQDSPAEKAGLKVGDVVLQYNGQRVEGMDQFSRMVRETPAGREVNLGIIRNGAAQTVTAKVGANTGPILNGRLMLPLNPQPPNFPIPDLPQSLMSWRSAVLGVDAETLDGQLAEYFGVKDGVLVRSVLKGSAAEKAGIKAGDVILRVGDNKVTSSADIATRLRPFRGRSVGIVLMRDRKEVTVTVTLEARGPVGGRIVGSIFPFRV